MGRPRVIISLDDLKAKLLARTAITENGCWKWLGAISHAGYGNLTYQGKQLSSHRVSYELHTGPIPKGMWVLHTCDNKWCVNPEHLFLGDRQDNADDAVTKGRYAKGHHQGSAKLKEDDVRTIRKMIDEGCSLTEIAYEYGVSATAISWIKSWQNWGWLE